MSLHTIAEFYPEHTQNSDHNHIRGFVVYSGGEKIGAVDDILVDGDGNFRYLVINTSIWIFGKKILLPIGRCRLDYNTHRVNVDGVSRAEVKSLPEYNWQIPVDYNHEEQVRGVYSPIAPQLGTSINEAAEVADDHTYDYKQEPGLYEMNHREHQSLKLYEEQLMIKKNQQKH